MKAHPLKVTHTGCLVCHSATQAGHSPNRPPLTTLCGKPNLPSTEPSSAADLTCPQCIHQAHHYMHLPPIMT